MRLAALLYLRVSGLQHSLPGSFILSATIPGSLIEVFASCYIYGLTLRIWELVVIFLHTIIDWVATKCVQRFWCDNISTIFPCPVKNWNFMLMKEIKILSLHSEIEFQWRRAHIWLNKIISFIGSSDLYHQNIWKRILFLGMQSKEY